MKFEMAAADASQSRDLPAGLKAAPGGVFRLAPAAARLEVTGWAFTEFNIPLSTGQIATRHWQIEKLSALT